MSRVTRALWSATLAAGVSFGLLAEQGAAGANLVPQKAPVAAAEVRADAFRADNASYLRELNEQLKQTFRDDLRRELAPTLVLASNELRARG